MTPDPRVPEMRAVELTGEELALLRASIAFHARHISDPALRERLESTVAKLNNLVSRLRAA